MSVGVSYNSNLVRISSFTPNFGMIGKQIPAVLRATPSSATIKTGNSALDESNIIAILEGDVLLNSAYETPVRVQVDTFANGYSRIVSRDGLVRAQYCAFSARQINTSKIATLLSVVESPDYPVVVYTSDNSQIHVTLVSMLGETVGQLFNGTIESGTHRFALPDGITNGLYFVVMTTVNGVLSEKCVVSR